MALTEEQITLASKFIENCLELGEASAKFDVCYLLQSAFAADDELIHFTSKNPPEINNQTMPCFRIPEIKNCRTKI